MTNHTLTGLRQQFKAQGKFHTSTKLAKLLATHLPDNPRDVYDPTCGAGALLAAFPPHTPKYGQDIDQTALDDAATLTNIHLAHGDVLTNDAWPDKKFHAIAANPPFSIAWEPNPNNPAFTGAPTIPTKSKADFAFLLHIIHHMADDAQAAILNFPGIGYRGGREQKLREYITNLAILDKIILIPGGYFEDTTISTLLLVFDKTRDPTAPIHIEDQQTGLTEKITPQHIADEEYSWSPSTYIQPPVVKEEIDEATLNKNAWDGALNTIRATMDMQKMMCEHFTNEDFEQFRTEAWRIIMTT